jgi:ubiquinone/menaquinone biosynthesis C-methylase UbiE
MRSLNHAAYRLAIDEYRAQLRFLLPLTAESRVLHLRCGWGPVALNLATCTAFVVAMDDRCDRLRFVSARRMQVGAETLHTLCSSPSPNLPLVGGTFDAVIMLDALEQVGATNGANWKGAQHAMLDEVRRVLRSGGWLLLGVANRLGFARPHVGPPQHLRTYWGYRQMLHNVGFTEFQFHAPLPSHQEPFFILPLDRSRLLNYFVDKMFMAQDYWSKLEARGLGSAYRLAWAMWRVGRRSRLTGLARYVVPSYLILARK